MNKGTKRTKIWCFNCDSKLVELGKKCLCCGIKAFSPLERKKKYIIMKLKLDECANEEL